MHLRNGRGSTRRMRISIIIPSLTIHLHHLTESLQQPRRRGGWLLPCQRESQAQRGEVTCLRSHSKWQSWHTKQGLVPETCGSPPDGVHELQEHSPQGGG